MKRIIVPTDFGAAAGTAIHIAQALAHVDDATVVLHHVLPVASHGVVYGEVVALPAPLMLRLESYQEERARRRLQVVAAAMGLHDLRTAIEIVRGDIAASVIGVATAEDLIVVGANERHLTRAGLAEELCRTSPCPLLACHAQDEPVALRRAVVAVDGSEQSAAVARMAAEVVGADGALELVHVISPGAIGHIETDVSGLGWATGSAHADVVGPTVRDFEDWIDGLSLGVSSAATIANLPPAQAVLERAVAIDADLVACGAHRESERVPLGLAEMLLRHSPLPVLVANA